MNTPKQDKPPLRVSVKHVGPIMSLDAVLSRERQNLIFARNGTGKSFIARALWLLDAAAEIDEPESEVPSILVSEESVDKMGRFQLHEGTECIGGLHLNAKTATCNRDPATYIYHVFSEDFVGKHTRNKLSKLDGNLTHEIIIGQENAELDQKKEELERKRAKLAADAATIREAFILDREKLKTDFAISATLSSFKGLSVEPLLTSSAPLSAKTRLELQTQFDTFKSLPTEPQLPHSVDFRSVTVDQDKCSEVLARETSPSKVAQDVKDRIFRMPTFYSAGLSLRETSPADCPFCTRQLDMVAAAAIDSYIAYFADAEAKHIGDLSRIASELEATGSEIAGIKAKALEAIIQFDNLKKYFEATSSLSLADPSDDLDALKSSIETITAALSAKKAKLGVKQSLPVEDLSELANRLSATFDRNNALLKALEKNLKSSKDERLRIQNECCVAFSAEFAVAHCAAITALESDRKAVSALAEEIAELSKTHSTKSAAKTRVVETFTLLLRHFFDDLYIFDEKDFSVKRSKVTGARGPDRTLSDGEKSVLAFCYFIARIHLRILTLADYKRLFLIVDDPVSSLSYDYVYAIAQALKCLRFTADGEVVLNMDSSYEKPRMLILTHNSYFYNVASANRLVKAAGLFQLIKGPTAHTLKNQKGFATPHLLQLNDVRQVSEGKRSPDHTTANSIRSVVEGMWRFIRPDLSDFEHFVQYLISENYEVKSVLINDLSHGGKFSDPPHQEAELILAATEAIKIVNGFAPGQLLISPDPD